MGANRPTPRQVELKTHFVSVGVVESMTKTGDLRTHETFRVGFVFDIRMILECYRQYIDLLF